jgi:hypothetical protein
MTKTAAKEPRSKGPDPDANAPAEEARLVAEQTAIALEAQLAAGDRIDEEAGDLVSLGWHLARSGKVVRLATWDGQWATELESEQAGHEGFERLVAERA